MSTSLTRLGDIGQATGDRKVGVTKRRRSRFRLFLRSLLIQSVAVLILAALAYINATYWLPQSTRLATSQLIEQVETAANSTFTSSASAAAVPESDDTKDLVLRPMEAVPIIDPENILIEETNIPRELVTIEKKENVLASFEAMDEWAGHLFEEVRKAEQNNTLRSNEIAYKEAEKKAWQKSQEKAQVIAEKKISWEMKVVQGGAYSPFVILQSLHNKPQFLNLLLSEPSRHDGRQAITWRLPTGSHISGDLAKKLDSGDLVKLNGIIKKVNVDQKKGMILTVQLDAIEAKEFAE